MAKQKYPGWVRIIGGCWRGRRIAVPELSDLRPTGDRIRETLFNWLAAVIEGAQCLDLFAGAGALGLEAASRGAARVMMLDQDRRVAAHLQAITKELNGGHVEILCADALRWLATVSPTPFDIVFLDPPFRLDCLAECCRLLASRDWLKPGAWVYLETARRADMPQLPPGWKIRRDKTAGEVRYMLVEAGTTKGDAA
ncbi:MAG TPA: 16S rRNA (guanine(966)-N(2))-methyltransferase RsmD [Gammaproteobacteria bacterium]|nr:16S rRNA (guanine(966)-N(2))-methyltransferase RsmD [Gammaproteobacteria bacterium]